MTRGAMRGFTTAVEPTAKDLPVPDDLLVGRACEGDTDSFAVLIERYKRPVYNLAYRMLGNAADAEDAAQETFVRAYTRLHSYQPGARFGSWLLAITSHWCIDHLRRRRPLSLEMMETTLSIPATGELPESLALHAERRTEVREWLARLPESYRLVLVLRYWHDLTYAEIAETIGQPVSTVRMRLFRARQYLSRDQDFEHAAAPRALAAAL